VKIGDLVLRLYNPLWNGSKKWSTPGVVIDINQERDGVEVLHNNEVWKFLVSELEVVDESR
jgi:hypothetical protein